MSKYSYDLNVEIEDVSSFGKILHQIKPSSTVLEFGSASGLMTKFMTETLKCDVWIVEYNREDYNKAIQYAKGGFCGDIMTLEWESTFSEMKFDYILFADVLEHLYDPWLILKRTQDFLKEDGTLLTSIPNIAHTDILVNLYRNHFDYTDIGLLDNTHIRFFAYYNLKDFAESAGYKIVREQGTYKPVGTTEQAELTEDTSLASKFSDHSLGTIYQFVLALQKEDFVKAHNISLESELNVLDFSSFQSTFFFDTGEGFNEESSKKEISGFSKSQQYTFVVPLPENTKGLRFDPVEGFSSIVSNLTVYADDVQIPIEGYVDGIVVQSQIFFKTIDPQIFILIPDKTKKIRIECLIYPMEESYSDSLKKINTEFAKYISDIHLLNENLGQQRLVIDQIVNEKTSLLETINAMNHRQKELAVLLDIKDQEILALENKYNGILENKKQMESSLSWRLTKPLRWIKSKF